MRLSTQAAFFTSLTLAQLVQSAVINLDWDITWVTANPDGEQPRPVIGINGQWPCPAINANVGDEVIARVTNKLGNETTSLHWHGIHQQGTTEMDGPSQVSQCSIPPGSTITYAFNVNQAGTYWYHSHDKGQYPDGLRGPLIVKDWNPPFHYDQEYTVTTSDWYHDQMPGLIHYYQSAQDTTGQPPIPNSNLLNDQLNTELQFSPGKTYFVRLIDMSAFMSASIEFDQHDMTIVEIDGVYVTPQTVKQIYITPAQRYGVLIKAKNSSSQNYAFTSTLDFSAVGGAPASQTTAIGYLTYDKTKPRASAPAASTGSTFDDFTLVPLDRQPLLGANHDIQLDVSFGKVNGIERAFFNGVTYLPPKVPSLYTALTTGQAASDPKVYGVNANAFTYPQGAQVQVIVNNGDDHAHPFHMHGHDFQVVARGAGTFNGDTSQFPHTPMRRDTVNVNAGGHVVLRFTADNPGVWLFHCHIEWHVDAGLTATFIEAADKLQQLVHVPQDHIAICNAQGIPTKGNAAGNSANVYDLDGANTQVPAEQWGALVASQSRIRRHLTAV